MMRARRDCPRALFARARVLLFQGLSNTDELGQHNDYPTKPAALVLRPTVLDTPRRRSGVERMSILLMREEHAREAVRRHESVPHGRHVIVTRIALDQNRLTKQVTQGHPQRRRQLAQHVESSDLPVAAFNLAQPVL